MCCIQTDIFLESITYIANAGLHYLQACLLLQLLLLLDCTGDKSRGGVGYEQWMTKYQIFQFLRQNKMSAKLRMMQRMLQCESDVKPVIENDRPTHTHTHKHMSLHKHSKSSSKGEAKQSAVAAMKKYIPGR